MNILITGACSCHDELLYKLEQLGHTTVFLQQEKDPLPCKEEWVEGVICNGLFLFHDISTFKKLKYIQTTSSGLDRIPLDYCLKHNVVVNNAKGVYSVPMAEFAVSGVLDLYKKKMTFYDNQKKCLWCKERNLLELFGKTVLIVGCGNVGTECAKRFKAFGCNVIGADLKASSKPLYENIYDVSKLEALISESDIILISLPLTESTKHLFDEKKFSLMKNNAILVNISRGGVIDERALIKHLDDNLLGAVIDVFECEPLDSCSPLWQKNNLLISPHNSFVGEGNNYRLTNLIIENIKLFGGGKK